MSRVAVAALLIVACSSAARGPATTGDPPPSPQQLLERTARTYATAPSYRDHGTVTVVVDGKRHQLTFSTTFVRDHALRFDYQDARARDGGVIWTDGTTAYSLARAQPDQVEAGDSLWAPLAKHAGGSYGTSVIVPSLLLDHSVLQLEKPAVTGTTTIGGHACWQPTGELAGRATTVAIDRDSFALRRVQFREPAEQTLDYEPTFGATIAEADLRGPDITGMQVLTEQAPTWIGVLFEERTNRVRDVLNGSPAERAGVQRGDAVLLLDGVAIATAQDVIRTVQAHKSGDQLALVVDRGGARTTLHVTVETRPDLEGVQRRKLVDKLAPDIELSTLDGKRVKLADLRGKVVVVDFWASWCRPCISAFPSLVKWHRELGPKGLVVVGVTDDELDGVKAAVTEHKLPYAIALDPDRVAWRDYLVQALPTTVVIDRSGVVRYVTLGAGEEAAIEASLRQLLR